jgi:hypothetical protein
MHGRGEYYKFVTPRQGFFEKSARVVVAGDYKNPTFGKKLSDFNHRFNAVHLRHPLLKTVSAVANRFACGCRSGTFTPSFDLRKQGEPGCTLQVGHSRLKAGHIFRSYFANWWGLVDIG